MFSKKIVVAIFALLLSACASSKASPVTEVTISSTEFLFEPAEITIPANVPVTFTIINNGTQEHSFVIEKISVENLSIQGNLSDEFNIYGAKDNFDMFVLTAKGNTSRLVFTATELGTYKIFCTVPGHEMAGMVGKLIVVSQ